MSDSYKRYAKQQRAVGLPVLSEVEWLAERERGQAGAEAWDAYIERLEQQEREGRKQIATDRALGAARNAARAEKRQRKFPKRHEGDTHNEASRRHHERQRRRLGK